MVHIMFHNIYGSVLVLPTLLCHLKVLNDVTLHIPLDTIKFNMNRKIVFLHLSVLFRYFLLR
jgi:hypothetical protein